LGGELTVDLTTTRSRRSESEAHPREKEKDHSPENAKGGEKTDRRM